MTLDDFGIPASLSDPRLGLHGGFYGERHFWRSTKKLEALASRQSYGELWLRTSPKEGTRPEGPPPR